MDEAIQPYNVEVVSMICTEVRDHAFNEAGFAAAPGADHEHGVAFAGKDSLREEGLHLLIFIFRKSIVEGKMLAGDWSKKGGFEGGKGGGRDGGEDLAEGFESIFGRDFTIWDWRGGFALLRRPWRVFEGGHMGRYVQCTI